MSAQVTILQLPAAGAITGTESVPIVQNGVTVQTTTGAIASAPSQPYTYLTVNQTPQLPNSRYVGVTNGLVITDAGAQGLFNISTTGALLSLVNSGAGIQVKTDATTLVNRSIAITGAGLSVTNGDGIAGNPTLGLTGQVLNLANASFNGFMVLTSAGAITTTTLVGTANQIGITNTNGVGNPVFSIADDAVFPGVGAITLPVGTTGQRPAGVIGNVAQRFGQVAYKDANDRIAAELAELMMNPQLAAQVMESGAANPRLQALVNGLRRSGTAIGATTPGLVQANQQ